MCKTMSVCMDGEHCCKYIHLGWLFWDLVWTPFLGGKHCTLDDSIYYYFLCVKQISNLLLNGDNETPAVMDLNWFSVKKHIGEPLEKNYTMSQDIWLN